jgi:hypothetical protein
VTHFKHFIGCFFKHVDFILDFAEFNLIFHDKDELAIISQDKLFDIMLDLELVLESQVIQTVYFHHLFLCGRYKLIIFCRMSLQGKNSSVMASVTFEIEHGCHFILGIVVHIDVFLLKTDN